MGKPAYPLCYKLIALCAAALIACGLAPAMSLADESVAGGFTPPAYENDAQSASPDSNLPSAAEGITLASSLAPNGASIVSADVALDAADLIIGSFTVDGLTYAVGTDGLALVAVGTSAVSDGVIAIPATVAYGGATYDVTAVGPYAFYLSGATSVELPASVASVDDRAFRSSDVARVEVDQVNPNLASFDGCLYDSQLLSLLLIPEGRAGAVLLPCEAEVVQASKFSHCSLVDAIDAGEGGAAFASWEGLLYDASGTTLLRVPAGATEITIRDGCTTIAAGAMEGCAKLERINAPASVTSISPDLFESVPTVALPAQSALQDDSQVDSVAGPLAGPGYEGDARSASADPSQAEETEGAFGSEVPTSPQPPSASSTEASGSAPQLTAMVALSSTDDDLPEVSLSSIGVSLPDGVDAVCWQAAGFIVGDQGPSAEFGAAASYSDEYCDTPGLAVVAPGTFYINNNESGPPVAVERPSYGSVLYFTSQNGTSGNTYKWNGSYVEYAWNATTRQLGVGSVTSGVTSVWTSKDGYLVKGQSYSRTSSQSVTLFLNGAEKPIITWDANGGQVATSQTEVAYKATTASPVPTCAGYLCTGWYEAAEGGDPVCAAGSQTPSVILSQTLYAQWERVDYDLGFDTSKEPSDEDYPAEAKPSQTVNVDDGTIEIEDPKRPGYVFEGWVIPNGDGTEAVDQELVYQDEADGKWYIDASKLPDYADSDGKVELTARWTSVISVDVPSSVTFYADLVTQGQESREGSASSAFGQSKVANQSQVDLRVVGLESSAVETTDATLGADSILKKAEAATPSTSAGKLLSLYPSTKAWTADELQDPDAVGGSKAVTAVDFDLDDILLEKSFSADDFTIAAGGTLNMGYRLNLSETGQQLDYDKLSTLEEGQSASIANVSYCFATSHCLATGTTSDDIYIEYGGKVYGTADILHAADCISELGEASPCYALYEQMMHDQGVPANGYLPADAKAKVYAKYDDPEATATQPNCDRAGYVRLVILGVHHDVLELKAGYPDADGFAGDGSKDAANGEPYVAKRAGLTFQFMDILEKGGINGSNTNSGGWEGSSLRSSMNNAIIGKLAIKGVVKATYRYRHNYGGVETTAAWQKVLTTTQEGLFLPSPVELCARIDPANDSRYADNGGVLAWHNHEGYEYEYYKICGLSGTGGGALAKRDAQGRACSWWYCQPTQSFAAYWYYVSESGGRSYGNASSPLGIAPVFCL